LAVAISAPGRRGAPLQGALDRVHPGRPRL